MPPKCIRCYQFLTGGAVHHAGTKDELVTEVEVCFHEQDCSELFYMNNLRLLLKHHNQIGTPTGERVPAGKHYVTE